MQEIIFKISYFESELFTFSLKHSPFYWAKLSNTKGSGTSDQSLFRLENKFKNILLFVIYYLTKSDDVM